MSREPLRPPTRAELDELLSYLPGFEVPGRRFVRDPDGDAGHTRCPYPRYDEDVISFFVRLGAAPWMDPDYRSYPVDELLAEPSRIDQLGFPELRALLNLCSRGERFSDGFWLGVLGNGVVQRALRRLAKLWPE